ncbi:uncharacterized protein LOC132639598 [Lycium barbarum]|uniref:uncharacterized protein LOC132639598 n=1 Tax=Lycium barbarum TaxID=112863 RepID=UPI00293F317D|nr:uncharacterized protein LOC132639598 [Lycium barbarum]
MPTEVRNFLGLAGYYRRFVEGFSSLSTPLMKLTQKTAKFQWNDACKWIFQELKDRLTSAPVLALPEGSEGYGDPDLKWEVVNIDFISGLPRSQRRFNSIWVIVDRLTKSANFLPVRTTYSTEDYAKLYIKEIV